MPVRLSTSSVLVWPDASAVEQAIRKWAAGIASIRPEVVRIGYFGSYARGNWGPGSDVDLIVIVRDSEVPFDRRASGWDATDLPVPADILVYTLREWSGLPAEARFRQTLAKEAIWVFQARNEPERPFER